MLKHVLAVLFLNSVLILCRYVPEGAECEWEGVKGKCVRESKCYTRIADNSPLHPFCPEHGKTPLICCTDCKILELERKYPFWHILHNFLLLGRYDWRDSLANMENEYVLSPLSEWLYKDGRKARDNCLQYIKTQNNKCIIEGYHSKIKRYYDEEKKCYTSHVIAYKHPGNATVTSRYPHQAILGVGEVDTALLPAGGAIITNRYILTAASATLKNGPITFVAVGIVYLSRPSTWQTHKVKRFIKHPNYKKSSFLNDIALVQTVTEIQFSVNVLPACLMFEEKGEYDIFVTAWTERYKKNDDMADKIIGIGLNKFNGSECAAHFGESFDPTKQLCYGSRKQEKQLAVCRISIGVPVFNNFLFSSCVNAIIGVKSRGPHSCAPNSSMPHVYTSVLYYVPWIESIVWP